MLSLSSSVPGSGGARRIPVRAPAFIRTPDGEKHQVLLRLVTVDDLVVEAELRLLPHLAPGTRIDIVSRLPNLPGPIATSAEVEQADASPDEAGTERCVVQIRLSGLPEDQRVKLDAWVRTWREPVLIVDATGLPELAMKALLSRYDILVAKTASEGLKIAARQEVAVLLVGTPAAEPGNAYDARRFLTELNKQLPGNRIVKVVVAAEQDPTVMQELINTVKIFYFLHRPSDATLAEVVKSAVTHYWKLTTRFGRERSEGEDLRVAQRTQRILDISRQLSVQRDLPTAGRLLVEAVVDLIGADRARYLMYDSIGETLWTDSGASDLTGGQRFPVTGLAGLVARTGAPVHAVRALDQALYQKEVDDPEGRGDEQLLVEPVLTSDRRVIAVVVAVRAGTQRPFGQPEIEALRQLTLQCGPSFTQMTLQAQIEEVFARAETSQRSRPSHFRREAMDAYSRGDERVGSPLRLEPGWLRWTYYLLAAFAVTAAAFITLSSVNEYATGPTLVRVEGRTDLTAVTPSTVAAVEVQPGQRVETGQLLVHFYDAEEQAALDRLQQEFELQLVKSLRNPSDAEPRAALTRLRAERELARAHLAARSLKAPHAGVINDVRIRPGQHLPAGSPILSITRDDSTLSIVALLPGQFRPLLQAGMPLRLEVEGFRHSFVDLQIETIGDEVVGPEEARRFLGTEVGDTVQLSGPVVLVKAHLPQRTFVSDGKTYNYHDGMHGKAEVRVRSERLLFLVAPGLKRVFEPSSGEAP